MPQPHETHILIHCEGSSEKQYLSSLVELLGLQNHVTVQNPPTSAPTAMMVSAFKEFTASLTNPQRKPITEIWLVFDRDHHPGYEAMMQATRQLSPLMHFCWTNPCIEYWFWLHFSTDTTMLHYDDAVELDHHEARRPLENGDMEVVTTRKVRPSILPNTMLRILTQACGTYDKVKTPAKFAKLALKACENHKIASQGSDPLSVGTNFPLFIDRLFTLAKELSPNTDFAARFREEPLSNVPSPTAVTPALPAEIEAALQPCLQEWPQLRLCPSCIEGPADILEHMNAFFDVITRADVSDQAKLEASQALKTLTNLTDSLKPGGTFAHRRYTNVKGRLDCLGTILKRMVILFGKNEESQVLGPVRRSQKLSDGSVAPKITQDDTEVHFNLKKSSDVLRRRLKDFESVMAGITTSEGQVPQENNAGTCLTAAGILVRARWAVEACIFAAALPSPNPDTAAETESETPTENASVEVTSEG